uniref:Quinol:cytochrome c oxidoreductase membrane protein n=1 Tax=Cupriavidus pinatubonensis (strain JMP 134 / LMG 1197) TaxID=264198 RepID=Q46SV3_CUPPJ
MLDAARRARAAGFTHLEAFTPYPVEGLAEAIGMTADRMPLLALLGGLTGGLGGFLLQWYAAVIDYPLNIGGRPAGSWQMFVPVTFSLTILGAALTTVIGMLVANRLPRLRHPLFDAPDFEQASRHRFFLCIRPEAAQATAAFRMLATTAPLRVSEVPQ